MKPRRSARSVSQLGMPSASQLSRVAAPPPCSCCSLRGAQPRQDSTQLAFWAAIINMKPRWSVYNPCPNSAVPSSVPLPQSLPLTCRVCAPPARSPRRVWPPPAPSAAGWRPCHPAGRPNHRSCLGLREARLQPSAALSPCGSQPSQQALPRGSGDGCSDRKHNC